MYDFNYMSFNINIRGEIMRIGLAQMDIIFEDKHLNMLKVENLLKDANKDSIDLLVFPELTLTGFSMNLKDMLEGSLVDSPSIAWFCTKALEYNINIAFGYIEICGDKGLNNLVIISKHGTVLSKYSKIHPFSYGNESKYYKGGDEFILTRLGDLIIGSTICYDLRFPELYQILSKKANIILVIANWPHKRKDAWITLLKARAIENQCYIVGVNKVGMFGNTYYSGDSMIIDPLGNIITSLSDSEGIIYTNINIKEVDGLRKSFTVKEDRKNLLYIKGLTSNIPIKDEREDSNDIS